MNSEAIAVKCNRTEMSSFTSPSREREREGEITVQALVSAETCTAERRRSRRTSSTDIWRPSSVEFLWAKNKYSSRIWFTNSSSACRWMAASRHMLACEQTGESYLLLLLHASFSPFFVATPRPRWTAHPCSYRATMLSCIAT